ncbi:pyroglutamyl-peptidase I [Nocardia pseudobrasiliensis]|uniref:Pyroglutamyl-peptidase I n=1 Tax=Nocardia pseudobrasiliensis TaxID=45979 RepID=A0A370IA33_9NOCA|nr:pyroglutamyl-peptidase I [Nocardia pseudobrasiliensis]RDI67573.1 pyroglutamyl-peptidase [Nocardia pseudobrasiliensis]
MRQVLITGFEPFDGAEANPSWDVAAESARRPAPDGVAVTAVRLPCVFDTALPVLRQAIAESDPALVICLGLAGGRTEITPERVAINLDDARIPDNAGAQPIDRPVVPGGPAAYLADLPLKAAVAAMTAAGVPAAISYTAGTFVCNHVFYGLCHLIATERPGLRGGFVHVPPNLPIDRLADGLTQLVRICLDTETDLAVPAGTLH